MREALCYAKLFIPDGLQHFALDKIFGTFWFARALQALWRDFTNQFAVVRAVQWVNVDSTAPMLKELDREAETLNVNRQAVIKTMLRESLDRHYLRSRHIKLMRKLSHSWL